VRIAWWCDDPPFTALYSLTAAGSDSASVFDSKGQRVAARALRRPGSDVDLLRVSPSCTLPTCPISAAAARPNVLMFGDDGVVMDAIERQDTAFQSWLASIPKSSRVTIVEVGAGKAIPTIRHTSEAVLRAFPSSTLVRINLDDADTPAAAHLSHRCISVGGAGALHTLQGIAAEMDGMAPL
jgi:hypothetical protein